MQEILQLIKPELLVLAPCLYAWGLIIKDTCIKNKFIPAILAGIGIASCSLYLFATEPIATSQQFALVVFMALTQGTLCAALAVYGNELTKYMRKQDGEHSE